MTRKHLNIQRIDNETNRTHSWFVIVQRRGKIYNKMFSDGVYGGKRKALQLAKDWRDVLIAKYPPLTKKQYVSIKRKNNQSGIPGVCRYASVSILSTGEEVARWYWAASWAIAPGKSKQVKFAINLYGEDVAFKKACAERRHALKRIEGDFLPKKGRRDS